MIPSPHLPPHLAKVLLQENPLDRENEELRLLLIFDGLDELSMQGKFAEEVARNFVEEVRFLVSRFNNRKLRLQVIISGREVVVQANKTKFRLPRHLLYLLPYFVPEKNHEGVHLKLVNRGFSS